MPRGNRSPHFPVILIFGVLCLLAAGCPHRSPLWSPDGSRLLILGGADGEPIDKPATRLWLLSLKDDGKDAGAGNAPRALRLQPPEGEKDLRYLGAAWIDSGAFALLTTRWQGEEAVEDSGAAWVVSAADPAKAWRKLEGPPPAAERAPRRPPVVMTRGPASGSGKEAARRALVYPVSSEAVAIVPLDGAGEPSTLEPAELVGVGPGGGFLIYRPEPGGTGGLELVAIGGNLEPLWSRKFSELAAGIGKLTGKRRDEVVFNDVSTSNQVAGKDQIGVNLVYTDVNWQQGVSGFHVILAAADGALVAAAGTTCFPGNPNESRDAGGNLWAWAVAASRGGDKAPAVRSFPLPAAAPAAAGAEVPIDLRGAPRSAVHGYSLSPDRRELGVVVNGPSTRLLLYPVEGGAVKGKPVEVELR